MVKNLKRKREPTKSFNKQRHREHREINPEKAVETRSNGATEENQREIFLKNPF
jgi:hypothetical protein